MPHSYPGKPFCRHWRVFYTHPRSEKKCEQRLREQNIEVFLPVCRVTRQWKDRRKTIDEPLFRNYIFANVTEKDRIRVLRTRGIVRCVSFGGKLAELTTDEIEQIRLLQSHPEQIEQAEAPPHLVGTEIKIERGNFRGLKGEVIEMRGETRLVVRVTSLNMAIRVEVPYSVTKSA